MLVPQLVAFVERSKTNAKPAGSASGSIATNDVPDPKSSGTKPAGGVGVGAGGSDALPHDSRALVAMGEKARQKGDYENAKRFYNAAVEINPNDSEALAGLGAAAYAQRDLAGARSYYKRVLSVNPNYTPALVGLGDAEWDSGDRTAAMKIYKDIVDRLPDGAYPPRVKQRSEPSAPTPTPAPGGDKGDQGGN
jgi:tetratricopeptide (TPR) repeat protein